MDKPSLSFRDTYGSVVNCWRSTNFRLPDFFQSESSPPHLAFPFCAKLQPFARKVELENFLVTGAESKRSGFLRPVEHQCRIRQKQIHEETACLVPASFSPDSR